MDLKRVKTDFIKMSIVLPLLMCVVLIVVSYFVVPPFIAWLPTNTDKTEAVLEYNPDDYYVVEYSDFSELRLNNFVGWMSSDDIGLGCAITYASENEYTDAVSLYSKSTEPWGDEGALYIYGENTDYEFRNLHKAKIGDTIDIKFNSHDTYTYKITKITTKETLNETYKHMNNDTLVMTLSFTDFENFNEKYFYHVFVAELVK